MLYTVPELNLCHTVITRIYFSYRNLFNSEINNSFDNETKVRLIAGEITLIKLVSVSCAFPRKITQSQTFIRGMNNNNASNCNDFVTV